MLASSGREEVLQTSRGYARGNVSGFETPENQSSLQSRFENSFENRQWTDQVRHTVRLACATSTAYHISKFSNVVKVFLVAWSGTHYAEMAENLRPVHLKLWCDLSITPLRKPNHHFWPPHQQLPSACEALPASRSCALSKTGNTVWRFLVTNKSTTKNSWLICDQVCCFCTDADTPETKYRLIVSHLVVFLLKSWRPTGW